LGRFGDQQANLYQSLEMVAGVVPVAIVASDHSDDARATFRASANLAAVAGQAGFLIVAPVTADIEVLSVTGASPGGATAFDLQWLPVALALGAPPAVPGGLFERSGNSPMRAFVSSGTAVGTVDSIYQVSGNVTYNVPVTPTIVEVGFAVALKCANLNQGIRFALTWRNVS
jgi:hypothetical protein